MTHTRFAELACRNGRCNEQRFYMGTGSAERILDDYTVVLILEKIDEGLAMLAVKLGFPFRALPYLRENHNTVVKMPNFTMEYRKQVQSTVLAGDIDLYKAALARFNSQLATLEPAEMQLFNRTLLRLRVVNERLSDVCEAECVRYESLSKDRKQCDNSCVERFLERLDDTEMIVAPTRIGTNDSSTIERIELDGEAIAASLVQSEEEDDEAYGS
jgi:hypothetical protein